MRIELLYSVEGSNLRLADEERQIYSLDGKYVDLYGKPIDVEEDFKPRWYKEPSENDDEEGDDWKWDESWIEDEGLEEKLISSSITEVEEEIDDFFGTFGYKNRAGEFVIEPQYASALEFTCGLAAVNLNRTWYKTAEGRRYYENHFGYIDHLGKTVIPFSFADAWSFNKYGIAVVADRDYNERIIDTEGNYIPGTENMNFSHYYFYDDRFLEFTYSEKDENTDVYDDDIPIGVYDTKERKIILEPSVDSIIEWEEDVILVYLRDGDHGISDFHQYYMNSKGEPIYTWLIDKGFAKVERPNKSLVSIVAVSEYKELTGNPSSYFEHDGKKYERTFRHGLYNSEEEFLLPMEYEKIYEISENIFECKKDGFIYVYRVIA